MAVSEREDGRLSAPSGASTTSRSPPTARSAVQLTTNAAHSPLENVDCGSRISCPVIPTTPSDPLLLDQWEAPYQSGPDMTLWADEAPAAMQRLLASRHFSVSFPRGLCLRRRIPGSGPHRQEPVGLQPPSLCPMARIQRPAEPKAPGYPNPKRPSPRRPLGKMGKIGGSGMFPKGPSPIFPEAADLPIGPLSKTKSGWEKGGNRKYPWVSESPGLREA